VNATASYPHTSAARTTLAIPSGPTSSGVTPAAATGYSTVNFMALLPLPSLGCSQSHLAVRCRRIDGNQTVCEEPPLANWHEKVAVATPMVQPSLGQHREVGARLNPFRGDPVEAEVGHVVTHHRLRRGQNRIRMR